MFLVGNSDGKSEDCCLWDTMRVGYSDVLLGDSGEGSPLGDSLGLEYGSELGFPVGRVSGDDSEGLEVCATGYV